MKRDIPLLLIIGIIVLFFIAPVTGELTVDIVPLATGIYRQTQGEIYDDKIVWSDTRGDYSHIYIYNLSNGTESMVTTYLSNQFNPKIFGNTVCYIDDRFSGNIVDPNGNYIGQGGAVCYIHNLSMGTDELFIPMTESYHPDYLEDFYGHTLSYYKENWTVCPVYDPDNPICDLYWRTWDVFIYDTETRTERDVSLDLTHGEYESSIWGNKIVYESWNESTHYDYLTSCELLTNSKTVIKSVYHYEFYPEIFDTLIVYVFNQEIYLYNLNTGTETQITHNQVTEEYPGLYENFIIWLIPNQTTNLHNLYLYNITTQEQYLVATNVSTYYGYPRIYENKIIWEDAQKGYFDLDLYMAVIDGEPPVADFILPATARMGENIIFDASASTDSDGKIAKYTWEFGDGEIATGEVVNHKYTVEGMYEVNLTVTDDTALTETVSKTIAVNQLSVFAQSGPIVLEETNQRFIGWANKAYIPVHVYVTEAGLPVDNARIYYSRPHTFEPIDPVYHEEYYTNSNGVADIKCYLPDAWLEGAEISLAAEKDGVYGGSYPLVLFTVKRDVVLEGSINPDKSLFTNNYFKNWFLNHDFTQHTVTLIDWLILELLEYQRVEGLDFYHAHYVVSTLNEYSTTLIPSTVYSCGLEMENTGGTRNDELWTDDHERAISVTQCKHPSHVQDMAISILASPGVLYVTAPDGSHAGYHPETGELIMDFPVAISDPGDEPFEIIIPNYQEGVYIFEVVGTGDGPYNLTLKQTTSEGFEINKSHYSGYIKEGEITPYYFTVVPSYQIDNLSMYPGWNFISIPKFLSVGNNTPAIFNNIEKSGRPIFSYDSDAMQWIVNDETDVLEPLTAYWIYSTGYVDVPLDYETDVASPPIKPLNSGWNAIGIGCMYTITSDTALVSIRDKWTMILKYDNGLQMYLYPIAPSDNKTKLNPGQGYWIYLKEPGELAALTG